MKFSCLEYGNNLDHNCIFLHIQEKRAEDQLNRLNEVIKFLKQQFIGTTNSIWLWFQKPRY